MIEFSIQPVINRVARTATVAKLAFVRIILAVAIETDFSGIAVQFAGRVAVNALDR